jgi:hypothetical protein
MVPFKAGELTILTSREEGSLRLTWLGKSSSRDPGVALRPFLGTVVDEASREGLTLELHFEKLEHFNSSTVAELIRLVNVTRERSVLLALYYDAAQRWQALSFQALDKAMKPFEGESAMVRVVAL